MVKPRVTPIKVFESTKRKLKKLRISKRESYDEVINRIIIKSTREVK